MTPDPDLTADVERWLTDQIRTNWPNITADVLDDDERPAVAAWFATEMARFEAWRREQGLIPAPPPPPLNAGQRIGRTITESDGTNTWGSNRPQRTPQGPPRRETPTDGTGIPPKPKTGTEGPKPTNRPERPLVLTHRSRPYVWDGTVYRVGRPMPPPKPGTHESDLRNSGGDFHSDVKAWTFNEVHDFYDARDWSRANRTTERTT